MEIHFYSLSQWFFGLLPNKWQNNKVKWFWIHFVSYSMLIIFIRLSQLVFLLKILRSKKRENHYFRGHLCGRDLVKIRSKSRSLIQHQICSWLFHLVLFCLEGISTLNTAMETGPLLSGGCNRTLFSAWRVRWASKRPGRFLFTLWMKLWKKSC